MRSLENLYGPYYSVQVRIILWHLVLNIWTHMYIKDESDIYYFQWYVSTTIYTDMTEIQASEK